MTNFYVAAAVLTLVALGLLLIPRWHSRRWQGESNLDWLTLRQSELESSGLEEQQTLSRDAELRILDETPEPPSEVAFESTGKFAGGTGGALLLVSTVVIVPVLLYFFLGAIEDVRITAALDNMQDASPAEVQSLVADIEVRSNAKPGNVEYLSLLGEYYTAQNEHVQALEIYE